MSEQVPLSRKGKSAPPAEVRRTAPAGERKPSVPSPLQRKAEFRTSVAAAKPNRTGLPDRLKAGVEALSGFSMDDVRVHYGSARPAQLQAHAFAQGTDIHLAPGQERHLPHEAWHVVQQKQGRVRPTRSVGQARINDDAGLEREADAMGGFALAAPASATVLRAGHGSQILQLSAADDADESMEQWTLFIANTEAAGPMVKEIAARTKAASDAPAKRKEQAEREARGLKSKTEAIASQAAGHFKEIELISELTNRGDLVTLGSDTTDHPDIAAVGNDQRTAYEVKAVSSAQDQQVGKVLASARKQLALRKTDQGGTAFQKRTAKIYIVNPANPWPWTALEAAALPHKPSVEEVAKRATEKHGKQADLQAGDRIEIDSLRWGVTVWFPQ